MTTVSRDGVAYEVGQDGLMRIHTVDQSDKPRFESLLSHVIGTPATKASFTSGDVFVVDLRGFGKATFVSIPAGTTMVHGAAVAWSHDGGADTHSSATLWTGQTGKRGAAMTILDNFAHITLTRDATNEAVYGYVSGRDVA